MSDPKRHHILPRTYLDGFSTPDGLVPCFNKSSRKSFKTSSLNAGVRKDFNTVNHSDGRKDRKTIEDFYGIVETDFPKMIAEADSPPVSPQAHDFFVQFAIRQKMRTPRAKENLGYLMKQFQSAGMLEHFQDTFSDEERDLLIAAQDGDDAAIGQIGLRVSGHYGMAIAAQLEEMGFVFMPVSCGKGLITCDDPVVIFGLSGDDHNSSVTMPLPSARKILLLPLTSKTLMYGDTGMKDASGMVSYHRSASLDVGTVRRINQILAVHAEEQLIADLKSNRELSDKVLRLHLTVQKRGKLQVNRLFSDTFIEVARRIERQLFPPNYFRS